MDSDARFGLHPKGQCRSVDCNSFVLSNLNLLIFNYLQTLVCEFAFVRFESFQLRSFEVFRARL